jgi:outer membrane protein
MFYAKLLAAAVAGLLASGAQAAIAPLASQTDLMSVYQQAVENNADLAASRADFAARQEGVPQARAGLLPNLSAGADVNDSRQALEQPAYTAKRSGTSYRATLSQPIFRADRWFQLKAAQAVDEQAGLELSATEQNLILQTAERYFNVGLTDKTDTLQSQASYDTARANRSTAQQQVDDAFQALVTLTNREYNALQGVVHTLPVLPPLPNDARAWVDTATQQNLQLLASNFAVEAAEQTLRQRKAGHAPTLDAIAQYEKGDNDNFELSNPTGINGFTYGGDVERRTIGLRLEIPLYSGGLTSSQVREAYQRFSQSGYRREGLRRQVVENTRNLHRAVNTDVELVQARHQSIISNQSAVEATEIGYQVGTRNIVDVLDAQRQLYASVRDYNNSRYDYILDNLRLKQAAGTLSPQDLQDLGQYLKPDYNPDKDFLPPDLERQAKALLKPNK